MRNNNRDAKFRGCGVMRGEIRTDGAAALRPFSCAEVTELRSLSEQDQMVLSFFMRLIAKCPGVVSTALTSTISQTKKSSSVIVSPL